MKSQRKRSLKPKTTKESPKKTKKSFEKCNELIEKQSISSELENNLFGFENELKYLTKIVNNTIENGESNSVLITGDPGSGKTLLLETYLKQIKDKENVSIIRLNGFINGNDLHTIKTIGRHFGVAVNNITDIMEGLQNKCQKTPDFRALIILDRFDVFCRRNQTLLYNLLDILQKSNSICIIGMTCRLDSIDLLEKRVKSRLNQRIIQLVTPFDDFEDYVKFATKLLNGRQMSDSLRESLKIQFSLNFSIRELKRLLLEDMVSCESGVETTVRDTKLMSLSQLSKYEISVLLIANKYITNQNKSAFHCNAIIDSLRHLPQIKINKSLLFKIIHKLVETDLISRQSPTKKNELLLSEWTLFVLNIDDSHLNEILNSNTFPDYMKQI